MTFINSGFIQTLTIPKLALTNPKYTLNPNLNLTLLTRPLVIIELCVAATEDTALLPSFVQVFLYFICFSKC